MARYQYAKNEHGEIVKADLELNIRTVADDAKVLLEKLTNIDNSIIPIRFDEFGATYHRFSRQDFNELINSPK